MRLNARGLLGFGLNALRGSGFFRGYAFTRGRVPFCVFGLGLFSGRGDFDRPLRLIGEPAQGARVVFDVEAFFPRRFLEGSQLVGEINRAERRVSISLMRPTSRYSCFLPRSFSAFSIDSRVSFDMTIVWYRFALSVHSNSVNALNTAAINRFLTLSSWKLDSHPVLSAHGHLRDRTIFLGGVR